jgi:hypothetical protein
MERTLAPGVKDVGVVGIAVGMVGAGDDTDVVNSCLHEESMSTVARQMIKRKQIFLGYIFIWIVRIF